MNDALLRLTLVLAYGPFFLMLGIFIFALLLKWAGKPDLLIWLIAKTGPQQPLPRVKSATIAERHQGEP